MVHKTAERFGLLTESVDEGEERKPIVRKTAHSALPLLFFSDFIFPLTCDGKRKKRDHKPYEERAAKRRRITSTYTPISQPQTQSTPPLQTQSQIQEQTQPQQTQPSPNTSVTTNATPTRKVRGRGSVLAGTGMKSDTIDHTQVVEVVLPIEEGKEGKLIHDYSDFKTRSDYDDNITPDIVVDSKHILEIEVGNEDLMTEVEQILASEPNVVVRWAIFKVPTKKKAPQALLSDLRAVAILETEEDAKKLLQQYQESPNQKDFKLKEFKEEEGDEFSQWESSSGRSRPFKADSGVTSRFISAALLAK
eukprot:TRINITY_DN1905_c0_g1_i1.p1 TRINITY_DN1905_c0_g1~~TRINITY_DN1905_c0_g1_i1.p1  ORF type:complete len:306 (-),score=68.31 TRINITY_DN1905_c0_g1_i1:26-943(-)